MASGIFAVLDDIAALMDDVAVVSKVTAQKTAGILGDDLAVNAEKATGFVASREIPVLLAISKGSLLNKVIIVPIALLLNAFFPSVIRYVLIAGGAYLAYEGVEKVIRYFFHKKEAPKTVTEVADLENGQEAEKKKVKSAIVTDFILSIEIVIIALSTVLDKPILIQVLTVSFISILATVGVYGIVALIVRMDDMGYWLMRQGKKPLIRAGKLLVKALPLIIKLLAIVGTIALLLVAGGIFVHQIAYFHQIFPQIPFIVKEAIVGLAIGGLAMIVFEPSKLILSKLKK